MHFGRLKSLSLNYGELFTKVSSCIGFGCEKVSSISDTLMGRYITIALPILLQLTRAH